MSTKEIVDQVRQEIAVASSSNATAFAEGEVAHTVDASGPSLSRVDVIRLCQQLASTCMHYCEDTQLSLELFQLLNRYCTALRQEELHNSRQTTLDQYFAVG